MHIQDDNENHGLKRKRLQDACDSCRRRKIRCDSATSPGNSCSNCVSAGTECTHDLQKKKRGPRQGSSKKAESQRSLVNAILSSTKPFVVPDDPQVIRRMLVDLANFARSLDRQLSLANKLVEENLDPPAPVLEQDPMPISEQQDIEDSIDSIAEDFRKMVVTHPNQHFGKSSYLTLMQSAIHVQRGIGEIKPFTAAVFASYQRPEFWHPLPWQQIAQVPDSLVFPEEDLMQELIQIYFATVNLVAPLLHRPTFERSVAAGLHLRNRSFGFTVVAVCAIASRQSNDPRNLCEGTTSLHSLGWKWFCQIPIVPAAPTDHPTLHDVQLCVLIVLYLQMTAVPDPVWTVAGLGIRYAQEMGAHRRKPENHKHTIEDELWNRAFWILVVIDLTMSVALGRPRITNPDDYDLETPRECDDEFWEHPDPNQAFKQPEGKPSVVSYFVTYCKLLDIVGFSQRALYVTRKPTSSGLGSSEPPSKLKAVIELDSALNKFIDEVPPHLKWDNPSEDFTFFLQSVTLHGMYNWAKIQVHRPFIPRPGQANIVPFPSLTICCNAARSIVHSLEAFHKRRDQEQRVVSLEGAPSLLVPVGIAVLVLLVSHWRAQQTRPSMTAPDCQKEMEYVRRCMNLIKPYEARYQTAGRIADLLNAIIAIGQHAEERSSDRPDSEATAATLAPEQTVLPTELSQGIFTFPNGCDRQSGRDAPMGPRTADPRGTIPIAPGDIYAPGVTTTLGQYIPGDDISLHGIMGGGTTAHDHNIFHLSSPLYRDYFSAMQIPDTLWYSLDNTDLGQEGSSSWNSFTTGIDLAPDSGIH
ncbi:hypothetical protein Moror_7694 [Moniliophthora roreri MCA 2997]|uniref:Zn(2)-C6 fungal-type domain-containing protein n=1 Tax=Moniliophthora roreri (strain MCA 2997) TaxID=1381753 RepID=V2XCN6_MONRO|nr:hypothetical protein Moror_7694 [Moniliophthora roreri MCA 2997]